MKMMDESAYKPCSCGGDCFRYFVADEKDPCWGPVEAIDEQPYADEDGAEDWYWVHACQGHINVYEGGKYTPDPNLCAPDTARL
jgi:hypothetical protein